MRVIGKHDDPEFTRRVASLLGEQLGALGFNIDFAPVADVDSNPKNPVIGDRSFGRDPALVTRHARAFAEGLEEAGIVACLKHFPGHGDTALDSHFELPVVDRSTVELRQIELYPFERAARSAQAVMTAHVVFTALDRAPATLSPRLIGLLRKEFAFEGVVFSDDLEMRALSDHWPIEETAISAVEAGCDALLVCQSRAVAARAHAALVARAGQDDEFLEKCARSVARSLALRQRFPQRLVKSPSALQAVLASGNAKKLQVELLGLTS
jgi:beta-N-acetylhexosaminidase